MEALRDSRSSPVCLHQLSFTDQVIDAPPSRRKTSHADGPTKRSLSRLLLLARGERAGACSRGPRRRLAQVLVVTSPLASNLGFRASELRDIERLIEDNADDLLQKWEEFHPDPHVSARAGSPRDGETPRSPRW